MSDSAIPQFHNSTIPKGGFFGTGVEVFARGELWRTPFDADPVASLGAAVSMVSNVTEFSCFMTPSNSCRLSWRDAFVGQVTADEIANGVATRIDAAMELFRNGDVLVETNGVSTLIPRVLPFPNDGLRAGRRMGRGELHQRGGDRGGGRLRGMGRLAGGD